MLDIIYCAWNLYTVIGFLHRGYHLIHYGQDCFNIFKKVSSYFGRGNKKNNLNMSFLIESTDIIGKNDINNWTKLSTLN